VEKSHITSLLRKIDPVDLLSEADKHALLQLPMQKAPGTSLLFALSQRVQRSDLPLALVCQPLAKLRQ
jgi:hypothetical protein